MPVYWPKTSLTVPATSRIIARRYFTVALLVRYWQRPAPVFASPASITRLQPREAARTGQAWNIVADSETLLHHRTLVYACAKTTAAFTKQTDVSTRLTALETIPSQDVFPSFPRTFLPGNFWRLISAFNWHYEKRMIVVKWYNCGLFLSWSFG